MYLQKINRSVKRFIKREDGASAIEYAIIIAMVALVLVGLSTNVRTAITSTFNSITSTLNSSSSGSSGSSGS